MEEQIRELTSSLFEYIPKMQQGIQIFIDQIENKEQDTNMVLQIIDGLQWIIEAVKSLNENSSANFFVDNLNEIFLEMLGAIENEDYNLLVEVMKYEIVPKLDEWNSKEVL